MKNTLTISHISVLVGVKQVLYDVSLTIQQGEVHVLMGPNGSGKSTLSAVIAGSPSYKILNKKNNAGILLNGEDILSLTPDEKARRGIFLAFQNPLTIPGVWVFSFLWRAYQTVSDKHKLSISEFKHFVEKKAESLALPKSFLSRAINDGFSGGEKKKLEMLTLLVLEPKFAIFDEIDTGLDVDSLKIVSTVLKTATKNKMGVLLITHYQRILKYINPDYVHILINGKLVLSGDKTLAEKIEKKGYSWMIKKDSGHLYLRCKCRQARMTKRTI